MPNSYDSIKRALSTGKINLHYQPICCLKTGELQGFEALARWGSRSPAEFIPLIQGHHLQLAWVRKQLGQIEELLAHLDQRGLGHLWVSFNVGRETLALPALPALLRSSAWPDRIHIEILESVGLTSPKDIAALGRIKTLHTIKADDVGAQGYDWLSRFVGQESDLFYGIKIDGELVRHIVDKPRDRAAVKSIINLALDCDLETTAEWVETEGQRVMLLIYKCQLGQGALFGLAMPSHEAIALARGGQSAQGPIGSPP